MAAKVKSIKKVPPVKAPKPVGVNNTTLAKIKRLFKRNQALNKELAKVKPLYQEKDLILEQLMELFVKVYSDRIVIRRSYTIGNQVFRLSTPLYDELKCRLQPKVWKSSASPTVVIE